LAEKGILIISSSMPVNEGFFNDKKWSMEKIWTGVRGQVRGQF
jgi:hypothetical protein